MLLFHNVITLRKLKEKEFAHWEYPIRKRPSIIQGNNIWSVGILDLMLFLFGTKEDAIAALKKNTEEISLDMLEKSGYRLIDMLIPFLLPNATLTVGDDFVYENQDLDIKLYYKCEPYNREIYANLKTASSINGSERKKIPFFQLMSIALENYCKLIEAPNVIRY